MSKHTTLPTVARVISDTYELPYAQAYAAAITTAQQLGITTSKSRGNVCRRLTRHGFWKHSTLTSRRGLSGNTRTESAVIPR